MSHRPGRTIYSCLRHPSNCAYSPIICFRGICFRGTFKAALAKVYIRKILCLKVEKKVFVIKDVILKQTLLILKTFSLECS